MDRGSVDALIMKYIRRAPVITESTPPSMSKLNRMLTFYINCYLKILDTKDYTRFINEASDQEDLFDLYWASKLEQEAARSKFEKNPVDIMSPVFYRFFALVSLAKKSSADTTDMSSTGKFVSEWIEKRRAPLEIKCGMPIKVDSRKIQWDIIHLAKYLDDKVDVRSIFYKPILFKQENMIALWQAVYGYASLILENTGIGTFIIRYVGCI